ncbi:MAG TPA: tetratricopeptide repeat protein, partial [bacterium]|nr:tetratricopeptide repeat protein [bacterium]
AAAEEAIRLAPVQGYAHYTRALALARLKRIPEARASCERAVSLDPNNADFRRDLGDLYLDGEPKTAETHYRASLALDASDAYALNNLGVSLKRQGRAKEAVLAFKSAMLLDPTLGAAKRNTHSTTQELLRTGSGIGVAVVMVNVARLVAGGASASAPALSWMLVALATVFALAAAILGIRALARRKKNALARLDPQLYDIFQRLDADKKAGRL